MSKRKPRSYEYTCRCSAYKFPHRFSGGKCDGFWLVAKTWEKSYGTGPCRHCNSCKFDEDESRMKCEVYEGQESVTECPVFQEFVEMNRIRC